MKLDIHVYNRPDRVVLTALVKLEKMVKILADKFDVLEKDLRGEEALAHESLSNDGRAQALG